jgi:hypothetical protein
MNLVIILGLILIIIGLWGLFTGKVIAGSRGFQANYYSRHKNPSFYYFFVIIYIGIGTFALVQSL